MMRSVLCLMSKTMMVVEKQEAFIRNAINFNTDRDIRFGRFGPSAEAHVQLSQLRTSAVCL